MEKSNLCHDSRKIKARLLDSLPERKEPLLNNGNFDLRCMKPLIITPNPSYFEYTLTLTINGLEIELISLRQQAKELEKDFNAQLKEFTHIQLELSEPSHTLPSNQYPIRYQNLNILFKNVKDSDHITIDRSKNKPVVLTEAGQIRLEADLNNSLVESMDIKGLKVTRDQAGLPSVLCSDVQIIGLDDFTHLYVKTHHTREVELHINPLKRMHFDQRISAEHLGVNLEANYTLTLEAEGGFLCPKATDEGIRIFTNKPHQHPAPVSCPSKIEIGPFAKDTFMQFLIMAGDGKGPRKFNSGHVTLKLTKSIPIL